MIDSTNPRILADNIRALSDKEIAEAAEILALQGNVEALGSYSTTEVDTGMKYGNDKIYRKVFFVEAMPDTTTLNIPHGVENLGVVLRLDGVMQTTNVVAGLPFPYGATYLLRYNNTNISIQTTSDFSFNSAIITMEYTKSAAPAALTSPAPDDTRSIEPEEIPEDEYIEPEVIEEDPEEEPIVEEEPVVEVKKTTRKKSTN